MYLDPGFGSMVIQVIIAFFAAIGAYLVLIRKKVASILFRNKQKGNGCNLENENQRI